MNFKWFAFNVFVHLLSKMDSFMRQRKHAPNFYIAFFFVFIDANHLVNSFYFFGLLNSVCHIHTLTQNFWNISCHSKNCVAK